MIHGRLLAAALAIVALAACGDDDSGGGGNGTADGGNGAVVLPPAPAACATPVFEAGSTIAATTTGNARGVAIAWSGTEAAVAYQTENQTPYLQRLDNLGRAVGTPILLPDDGHATADFPLGITSDGTSFLVCWEAYDGFNDFSGCAVVPVGGTTATPGFRGGGNSPVVASDHIGRVLVTAAGASYQTYALDAQGTTTMTAGNGLYLGRGGIVPLPTGGFVLGTSESVGSGGRRPMWTTLNSDGTGLGMSYQNSTTGDFLGLAANDEGAIMLLGAGVTDEPTVVRLTPDATGMPLDAPGVAALGGALARGDASFAAAWSYNTSGPTQFRYRTLGADGTPQGSAIDVPLLMSSTPIVALTAVDTGFLLATLDGGDVIVTRVACP